jgi:hypothetical protein
MIEDNICGLCGLPCADKKPHEHYWPGEKHPNTPMVHSECECDECERAFLALPEEMISKSILEGDHDA